MTEKWDELWTRDVPMIERVDWLYEVKAEGDAMKKTIEAIEQVIKDVANGEINPYEGVPLETIKDILEAS